MKKIFTLIAFLAVSLCIMAQSQYFYEWKDGKYIQRSVSEIDSITFSLPPQGQTPIVGAWSNGESLIKFNADGTGSIEEEGEVLPFGYTFNSSTNVVTITSGVFWEEEIKQIKIKFIADNIIQLGWWIDGEWIFEEDEKYYRQDGNEAKVNMVDLGLPSGTLWADRNVGADSPEDYGDYFAWGETEPKSTYNWSTYKWCQGSNDTMTKYCTKSNYGTVDNKTVLDLEDDAAYVNMGKDWRMPTETQMSELKSKCTWTWTTQNGTNGYKVTGPNGNSIFLPAAGYCDDGSLSDAGSNGVYWSASLSESYPGLAWYLFFDSSIHYMYDDYRDVGLTVRAVVNTVNEEPAPVVNKVDLGLPSGTLWADCNVGADSPEAYGDYFAWGETEPKDDYSLSTYKWCPGSYNGDYIKYCTNSSYGTIDNKTVLDLEDDAAYVNMGAEWRMPTEDEFYELISECSWTWTIQKGTKGCRVTGPNGNSIFLPAAGYSYDGSLINAGSGGYYWSAFLYDRYPGNAWYLGIYPSDRGTNKISRYSGHTVRAVAR